MKNFKEKNNQKGSYFLYGLMLLRQDKKNIIGLLMAKQNIASEFNTLLSSFAKVLVVLYKVYGPYIKIMVLGILAYLAYRIGRSSVIDKLEVAVTKIVTALKNRAEYSIHLPEKIKKISKIKVILFVLFILYLFFWLLGYFLYPKKVKKIKKIYAIFCGGVLLFLTLMTWLYELYLSSKLKKGKTQDLLLNQSLYSLQQQLGPRAEGLLRIFLCRDNVAKHKSSPTGICAKNDCKNERDLLRKKSNAIQILVNSAINFPWCSICKPKIQFEEFLPFQAYLYEPLPQEQKEAQQKNQYLFNEVLRMIKWIRQLSPCNCSQLYWRESTKYIRQYKKQQKQLDQELLYYQTKMIKR